MFFFFFNDTATTEIYTLSLHDALPISSTLPFVLFTCNSPFHFALPIDRRIPPLVVVAEAHWLVETSTLSFVVAASTTLFRLPPDTFPVCLKALNRAPGGTFPAKLIFARFPVQLLDSD